MNHTRYWAPRGGPRQAARQHLHTCDTHEGENLEELRHFWSDLLDMEQVARESGVPVGDLIWNEKLWCWEPDPLAALRRIAREAEYRRGLRAPLREVAGIRDGSRSFSQT